MLKKGKAMKVRSKKDLNPQVGAFRNRSNVFERLIIKINYASVTLTREYIGSPYRGIYKEYIGNMFDIFLTDLYVF